MRYPGAVARLESRAAAREPDGWPEPPSALMPVRLDAAERPPRTMSAGPSDAVASAVLVLVAPDREPAGEAEAEVILIERVDRGGHHSGEISFPGGRTEGDEDAPMTALREAREEVGLDANAAGVRVVGLLEPFWIPVSNFRVHPVLAIAAVPPVLRRSPDEVASIVRAPLDAFLPGARIEVVEREVRGTRLRFGGYPVAGNLVWGATARVLGQLGEGLAPAHGSVAS
jgi:8-oxo-dGTP pyrophosphatase MutT (NUDIX family)